MDGVVFPYSHGKFKIRTYQGSKEQFIEFRPGIKIEPEDVEFLRDYLASSEYSAYDDYVGSDEQIRWLIASIAGEAVRDYFTTLKARDRDELFAEAKAKRNADIRSAHGAKAIPDDET